MLKFPPQAKRNQALSYANSCVSEYLACHIFQALGFKTQETILGCYTVKSGQEKTVVACRDFTAEGKKLMKFAQLKNTCVDSSQSGYGTELSTILQAIEEQSLIEPQKLLDFFWEMFIADALLGNFDRHNGNWGLLIDEQKQQAEIAPVYDCGSCLYPQMDEAGMKEVLQDERAIAQRIFTFPTAAIMEEGRKISYFAFISSLKNEACNQALQRIMARLDWAVICTLIAQTPGLSELQQEFYQVMLSERKRCILDYSLELLRERESR